MEEVGKAQTHKFGRHGFSMKGSKKPLLKRSHSLKKKARELAAKSGASVCLLQFDQDGKLSTFPEDVSEVNSLLKRYLHERKKNPEKEKICGSEFLKNEAKTLNHVLSGANKDDPQGSQPSSDDDLLDAMCAFELLNFEHKLDLKIEKVKERMRQLDNKSCPRKKQKAPEHVPRYLDGTHFNPDDLQLGFDPPSSVQDCSQFPASPLDLRPALTANNVAANEFSFTGQSSTAGCSADGTPFKPDVLQLGLNLPSSAPGNFGLAASPDPSPSDHCSTLIPDDPGAQGF